MPNLGDIKVPNLGQLFKHKVPQDRNAPQLSERERFELYCHDMFEMYSNFNLAQMYGLIAICRYLDISPKEFDRLANDTGRNEKFRRKLNDLSQARAVNAQEVHGFEKLKVILSLYWAKLMGRIKEPNVPTNPATEKAKTTSDQVQKPTTTE